MSAKKRVTNNLVVMGSAAVVAVYAAGFVHTAAAAAQFAELSDERRVVPPEPSAHENDTGNVGGTTVRGTRPDGGATAAPSPIALRNAPPSPLGDVATRNVASANAPGTPVADKTVSRIDASVKSGETMHASAPAKAIATVAARASASPAKSLSGNPGDGGAGTATATTAATSSGMVAQSAAVGAADAPKLSVTSSPAAPNIAVPGTAVPVTPAPSTPAAPVSSSAATTAPPVAPAAEVRAPGAKWKDGGFYGWGTSRHGDIQAYLEIDGGKITYVAVAQCLTQYSCTLINHLPGQVLARQSADVDTVSGATQSANAFYYAIVQALSKAK